MFSILEFPDVLVDACLRDSEGRFLFLSAYGRDNTLLQFMASLQLPREQRGVDRFTLVDEYKGEHLVDVGGADRLDKHSGRLPKHNVFGPLSHLWLFDRCLRAPDLANRIAWVIEHRPSGAGVLDDKVWLAMCRLSPVPLLEHWRPVLMSWARQRGAICSLAESRYPPLGGLNAVRLSLGKQFLESVSAMVKDGELTLTVAPECLPASGTVPLVPELVAA